MYQGFTDEEDYFDPLGHNVSDGEDSAGSELDDLETRLYSQIHYGEQFNKEEVNLKSQNESVENHPELSTQETKKTGSHLLTELCTSSLPSASCPSDKHSSHTSHTASYTSNSNSEKKCHVEKDEDSCIVIDSSTADDNTEAEDILMIDRQGSKQQKSDTDVQDITDENTWVDTCAKTLHITKKNTSNKRTVEYIVVDTESDGMNPVNVKSHKKSKKDGQSKNNHGEDSDSSTDSDSDSSIVVLSSDAKTEFVSLLSEEEGCNEDISIHAQFGSESVMETAASSCHLIKDSEVDVEHSTLQQVLDSLEDCDWSSNPEHRPVHINTKGRYYQSKKCEKCDGKGHQSRDCPNKIPVCLQCGKKGHLYKSCPRPVCFNCLCTGHMRTDCTEPRRVRWKKCGRCLMQGHKDVECPNRWRQFHLTTDAEEPVRGRNKENTSVYCSNCGKEGHFYHDCIEDAMFGKQWETWPFIVDYNLEKEMDSLVQWRDRSITYHNEQGGSQKEENPKFKKQHSKAVISNNAFVKKKGKKRKWKEDEEETASATGIKKQKMAPNFKKPKKRKREKAKPDETVGYGKQETYFRHSDHSVVRQGHTELLEDTGLVRQKKNKKRKKKKNHKVNNEIGGKHESADFSQNYSKRPYKEHHHFNTNHRGFRYGHGSGDGGSGGFESNYNNNQTYWEESKNRNKWDKKQRNNQGGGTRHKDNRHNNYGKTKSDNRARKGRGKHF